MSGYNEMFNKAKEALRDVMRKYNCNLHIFGDSVAYMNSTGTCILVHNLQTRSVSLLSESTVTEQASDICAAIVEAEQNFKFQYHDPLDAALQAFVETCPYENIGKELYRLIMNRASSIDDVSLVEDIREHVGVKCRVR